MSIVQSSLEAYGGNSGMLKTLVNLPSSSMAFLRDVLMDKYRFQPIQKSDL